jgi:glucose/arabinose dehydrogenase
MAHSIKLHQAIFLTLLLSACESATVPIADGYGSDPQLPPPNPSLIPTVNVAPAIGWQAGEMPVAADGLELVAFAANLDQPRWLYVLHNGDVLVA